MKEDRSQKSPQRRGSSRREFVKELSVLGGAVVAGFLKSFSGAAATVPREEAAHVLDRPEAFTGESILERMRKDLIRALQKPVEQRKWIMVIDLQKCTGCKSCTIACIAENNLPPGVAYRPVLEEEIGEYPHVRYRYIPRPCMQCDNPPCTPVCPVNATYKRPDGVVAVDYDRCIGCRYCITACPYGARYFDFGEFYGDGTPEIMAYETRPSPEYNENRVRDPKKRHKSPIGNVRKCQFCLHRVHEGMLPSCVTTCLGGATYFGDYNDPKSLVRELIGTQRVMRLKEELGTEPSVYYLV